MKLKNTSLKKDSNGKPTIWMRMEKKLCASTSLGMDKVSLGSVITAGDRPKTTARMNLSPFVHLTANTKLNKQYKELNIKKISIY